MDSTTSTPQGLRPHTPGLDSGEGGKPGQATARRAMCELEGIRAAREAVEALLATVDPGDPERADGLRDCLGALEEARREAFGWWHHLCGTNIDDHELPGVG